MRKNPQLAPVESQESSSKNLWEKIKNAKLTFTTAIMIALASCGTPDDPKEEPNKLPTGNITNVISNDDTNTVSGKFNASDPDGNVTQKILKAEATDGSSINIPVKADGTFDYTFTSNGKTYNMLIGLVKDNEGASNDVLKNLTPTVTVEIPNVDSTVTHPTNTVDENSTEDVVLGIEDPNGVASVVFKDESTNELVSYFNIIEKNKLQLKTGVVLNHEVKKEIKGIIVITDDLGNEIEKEVIIKLNDLQEQQTIDVFEDGGLLPNGEAYAIKTDEEETGETLPIKYYNHGSERRLEAVIKDEIVNSNTTYGDAQSSIYNLYGTNIGPTYANGQVMLSYDGNQNGTGNNEMVIYAEDGSESNRVSRDIYGRMMAKIKERTGNNDDIQFTQDGKELNIIWEDMIILQAKHPDKLYLAVDKAIQNHLGQ